MKKRSGYLAELRMLSGYTVPHVFTQIDAILRIKLGISYYLFFRLASMRDGYPIYGQASEQPPPSRPRQPRCWDYFWCAELGCTAVLYRSASSTLTSLRDSINIEQRGGRGDQLSSWLTGGPSADVPWPVFYPKHSMLQGDIRTQTEICKYAFACTMKNHNGG